MPLLAVPCRRPDLRCLEHHPHLASLDVASAAGPAGCWALKDLQLGHLVHLERLHELRLAESGDSGDRGHNTPGSGGGSGASCSPYRAAVGCGKSGRCAGLGWSLPDALWLCLCEEPEPE
jgi:hypothetical protein